MLKKHPLETTFLILVMLAVILACGGQAPTSVPTSDVQVSTPGPTPTAAPIRNLNIFADDNIRAFEEAGAIAFCSQKTGVDVNITYGPATDLRSANLAAKEGDQTYQAFWGTGATFLPHAPVSFPTAKAYTAVATSSRELQREMGWDKNGMSVESLLRGLYPDQNIRLLTQYMSNTDPGATILTMLLTYMADQTMLTQSGLDSLTDEELQLYLKDVKSADSVKTMMELVVADLQGAHEFNTYFGYDANFMQLNKQLIALGLEPVHIYYLEGATTIANFPLAFTGGPERQQAAKDFASCFTTTPEVKEMLGALGYRMTESGMLLPNAGDPFFKEWGVDTTSVIKAVDYPLPEVTISALYRYQDSFKPRQRVGFCPDYSGSMNDNDGATQLTRGSGGELPALDHIFNQEIAKENGINAGTNDSYTAMIFYDQSVRMMGTAYGNKPAEITQLGENLKSHPFAGGTAMFECGIQMIKYFTHDTSGWFYDRNFPEFDPENYRYSIYFLTDGFSNSGTLARGFEAYWKSLSPDIRDNITLYGLAFGVVDLEAHDTETLIADYHCDDQYRPWDQPCSYNNSLVMLKLITGAQLFDGRTGLADNLRKLFSNN